MSKPNTLGIGDYATFHTIRGPATGIIEKLIPGKESCPRAVLTVRNGTFKPKKYIRPLYKLKPANL